MRAILLIAVLAVSATMLPTATADGACRMVQQDGDLAVKCQGQKVETPLGQEFRTEDFCIGDAEICDEA